MSDPLTLITELPSAHKISPDTPLVTLRADRVTLSKRRWRAKAANGREFGFDLGAPLTHNDCFFVDGETLYIIEQQPEPVLEIAVAALEEAACLAWRIGNLHLGAQVMPAALRVADDPAAVQLFEREGMVFSRKTEVFQPLSTGGAHHDHHAHA